MESNNIALFETFYFGKMNDVAKNNFKTRLKAEPVLKKEYRAFVIEIKAAQLTQLENPEILLQKDKENIAFFKQITVKKENNYTADFAPLTVEERETTKPRTAKIVPFYHKKIFLQITAAAVALLLIISYLIFTPPLIDNEALVAENDIVLQNRELSDLMWEEYSSYGENTARQDSIYAEGLHHFGNGETRTPATSPFLEYIRINPISKIDTAYYFVGELYRETKDFEQALDYYLKIDNQSKMVYRKYYSMGLVYIIIDRKADAKEAFEKVISSPDTLLSNRASKLIKVL